MAEVDLLLKLFDTLKDASKETQQLCHALLTNQNNITNYMGNLPMDELKMALRDHAKDSSDEIGTCTETVETKTDNILSVVKTIDSKVGKMILVVLVSFSLFSIAFFMGKYTSGDADKFIEWEEKIKSRQEAEHNKLIDAIREEFRNR